MFLCRQIRDRIRHELRRMYKSSEEAYASLDFTGLGFISEQAFLESQIVKKRIPYSVEQVKMFFNDSNLFSGKDHGISFDTFKKIFFPQFYHAPEKVDDAEEDEAKRTRQELLANKLK